MSADPQHASAQPTAVIPNAATSPCTPPALSSAQLLRGERELLIAHGNQLYRLRHTRNDKLILTK